MASKRQKAKSKLRSKEPVPKTGGSNSRNQTASSANAAQALGSFGSGGFGSLSGFGDLSSLSSAGSSGFASLSLSRATSSGDSVDVDDNEIQFCFRTLARKRDATTKLKAFKQLGDLFQPASRTSDELKKILPAFVHHLNRQYLDNERRVREALFVSFLPLVTAVGKGLAPHLKKVSKAAAVAFQTAFPTDKKKRAVLKFCLADYVEQVGRNLRETPQTLSDMTFTSKEEAQERYDRVILSTLLSLAALLQQLPADDDEDLATLFEPEGSLLEPQSPIWGLMNAKRPIIRKGGSAVCKVILTRLPELARRLLPKIAPMVLYSIHEKTKLNHQGQWELLLTLAKAFPECWEHVQLEKTWKGMWEFLRSGCYGSGMIVYPCLLPFLSLLPSTALRWGPDPGSSGFYRQFLNSIWAGRFSTLTNGPSRIISSAPVQLDPVIKAYFECAHYIFRKHKDEDPDICSMLINDIVLPLLDSELCPASSDATTNTNTTEEIFYLEMGKLLGTLLPVSNQSEPAQELGLSWRKVGEICEKAILQADFDAKSRVSAVFKNTSCLFEAASNNLHHLPADFGKAALKVFAQSFKQFRQTIRLAPVELCSTLSSVVNLPAILGASPKELLDLFVDSFIPALQLLYVETDLAEGVLQTFSVMVSSFISAVEKLSSTDSTDLLDQVWKGLFSTLSSSKCAHDPSRIMFLRDFLLLIVAPHPSSWGHPELDSLILAQTENMMECSYEQAHEAYAVLLQTCFVVYPSTHERRNSNSSPKSPRLMISHNYAATIISSLFEALLTFADLHTKYISKAEPGLRNIDSVKIEFSKQSGISHHALPCIIQGLSPCLQTPALLKLLSVNEPHLAGDKDRVLKALFWLRDTEYKSVAVQASEAFHTMAPAVLETDPSIVLSLAEELQSHLRELSGLSGAQQPRSEVSQLERPWVWATQVAELVGSVRNPKLQQQLLDTALPSHEDLQSFLCCFHEDLSADSSAESQVGALQHVRDCVYETLRLVGPGVLFLGLPLQRTHEDKGLVSGSDSEGSESDADTESTIFTSSSREWLVADIMCVESQLTCWTLPGGSDPIPAKFINYPSYFINPSALMSMSVSSQVYHCVVEGILAPTFVATLLQTLFSSSFSSCYSSPFSGASYPLSFLLGSICTPAWRDFVESTLGGMFNTVAASLKDDAVAGGTPITRPTCNTLDALLSVYLSVSNKDGEYCPPVPGDMLLSVATVASKHVKICLSEQSESHDLLESWMICLSSVTEVLGHLHLISSDSDLLVCLLELLTQLEHLEILKTAGYSLLSTRTRFACSVLSVVGGLRRDAALAKLNLDMVQSMFDWASECLHGVSTSVTGETQTEELSPFSYLPLQYPLYLLSSLLSLSAIHPFSSVDDSRAVQNLLQLLNSPALALLSVARGHPVLDQLAHILGRYFARIHPPIRATRPVLQRRQAKLELLKQSFASSPVDSLLDNNPTDRSPDFSPFRYRNFQGASLWSCLCDQLSHPCASVAACARHLLSISLRDRVVNVDLAKAVPLESQEEMSSIYFGGDRDDNSDDSEDEEKEAERRAARLAHQKRRLNQQMAVLFPAPVLARVELLKTLEVGQNSCPDALTMRCHLLTWSLVLDVVAIAAGPTGEADKKAALVTFLRENEFLSTVCRELFEHMTVSFTDDDLNEQLQQEQTRRRLRKYRSTFKGSADDILDIEQLCSSNGPRQALRVSTQMHRLRAMRRERKRGDPFSKVATGFEEDDELSTHPKEHIFFGGLAFRLFCATLSGVPAISRAWWTNSDRSSAAAISQLTAKYVSPALIEEELGSINRVRAKGATSEYGESGSTEEAVPDNSVVRPTPDVEIRDVTNELEDEDDEVEDSSDENDASRSQVEDTDGDEATLLAGAEALEEVSDEEDEYEAEADDDDQDEDVEFRISANINTCEVSARYLREDDDISMGVVVRLAKSHPLVPVTVELTEKVKIKETRAKRWQVTIASMLTSQNGTVRDALLVWKQSVDKHFEGVEECPICYAVIDSMRSLPRMSCRTCKNKFHSGCLHKWFHSSGNSKCPMCRKLF